MPNKPPNLTEQELTGATGTPVILGLCLGGIIQTWGPDNDAKLWQVHDPSGGFAVSIGLGSFSRTYRGGEYLPDDPTPRFREVGVLFEEVGQLMISGRHPVSSPDAVDDKGGEHETVNFESQWVGVEPFEGELHLSSEILDELVDQLQRVLEWCMRDHEFFLLELGGWDAPSEPYCIWTLEPGNGDMFSTIEAAPAPMGSELWGEDHDEQAAGRSMTAPLPSEPTYENVMECLSPVPHFMLDALRRWNVSPWDVALTFGTFPWRDQPQTSILGEK